MKEKWMEKLEALEEAFFDDEVSQEDVDAFFDLWPTIKKFIRDCGETDASGVYHKPTIEAVDDVLDDNSVLDSFFNLLSDAETVLNSRQYAKKHLKFCQELLEIVDTESEDTFVENYETGIGCALVNLDRKDEAKAHFEGLLRKAPKDNYITNALWAAYDMGDKAWFDSLIAEYVETGVAAEDPENVREVADHLILLMNKK